MIVEARNDMVEELESVSAETWKDFSPHLFGKPVELTWGLGNVISQEMKTFAN